MVHDRWLGGAQGRPVRLAAAARQRDRFVLLILLIKQVGRLFGWRCARIWRGRDISDTRTVRWEIYYVHQQSCRDYVMFGSFLSQIRLSVVRNVCAPYSRSWNFRQYFFAILYLSHPLTSVQNFTEIVPGKPLCRGRQTQVGQQNRAISRSGLSSPDECLVIYALQHSFAGCNVAAKVYDSRNSEKHR